MNANTSESFFPYDAVREEQSKLIDDIRKSIESRKSIIVHAPTGLGKTAASLAPALYYALKNNLSVFFLTSRHTQHRIAVETIAEIKKKFDITFGTADIIGKKWMCLQSNVQNMMSTDFMNYCKSLREKNGCDFYNKTIEENGKTKVEAKKLIEQLAREECHSEKVIDECRKCGFCPYEITTAMARSAVAVITDYFYIFHQKIRTSFFSRTKKELSKSIIIVDEGHNLPGRLRDLMSERLTAWMLVKAIREAKKFGFEEIIIHLSGINDVLNRLSKDVKINEEISVEKDVFTNQISRIGDYEEIIAELEFAGNQVRSIQKQSYISLTASFLESWKGADEGFVRILTVRKTMNKKSTFTVLSYKCLDPSILSREVIDKAHSVILMSGTLNPTEMYKDLLGFPQKTECMEYKNPFPKKNRVNLVVPETTTKYTKRNEAEFRRIAEICAEIVNEVKGNSAIFFPSYFLRDSVHATFNPQCRKTIFLEHQGLTKKEKTEMLENFKKYKNQGAVLLAVSSGSFGEGIDLPDILKCVIIVGLPLGKPDLETSKLIRYYDSKFKKGMEYGYIYPAMNKCLQSAGRCIRSETDRGVIVFLDERFAWKIYSNTFPRDMDIVVTRNYIEKIREFAKQSTQYTQ